MSDREIMQQALEALKSVLPELESVGPLDKFERARAAIALFERLAQPEQGPGTLRIDRLNQWLDASLKDCKPAREQPAQRKPLTDEEIGKIAGETLDPWSCARVIEAAHGIKENT